MDYWRKIKFLCIILALIAGSFPFILPTAHAQLVTVETNATAYFPAFATALGVQTSRGVNQDLLQILFGVVKKRVFDMTTDQIIDYINGNGTPQFITDWRGFFDTIGQAAVGDVVQQIGLGALCSPFKLQVQLAMIAPPRFSKQITCTINTIVRNVENFYLDFRNGGWLAYQELWAPNNNFYGSLLLAWNAKENEVAARLAAAGNEALAGQGFLSVKKCQKDRFGRDLPGTCVITTPGTAVGALAQKAVGADLDFIINSQDLATYVSAISDAFINRLIRSGVSGLTGIKLPNRPPQGEIIGVGCDAFSGRAHDDCLKYQRQYRTTYQPPAKASPAQINAALIPRQQARSILQSLIELENQIVNKAATLLSCQFSRNADTQETRTLLDQHQRTLERYQRAQSENDYIVDQLAAALKLENGAYAGSNILDTGEATAFLTAQQIEQNNHQTTLTDLNANLDTRISQCQGQP